MRIQGSVIELCTTCSVHLYFSIIYIGYGYFHYGAIYLFSSENSCSMNTLCQTSIHVIRGMYAIPSTTDLFNCTRVLLRLYDRCSVAPRKCSMCWRHVGARVPSSECGVYVCMCVKSLHERYGTRLRQIHVMVHNVQRQSASCKPTQHKHNVHWYVSASRAREDNRKFLFT